MNALCDEVWERLLLRSVITNEWFGKARKGIHETVAESEIHLNFVCTGYHPTKQAAEAALETAIVIHEATR